MAVYRFRITYEDHDDVYRDIEIRSTQTFDEFHRAIQESIGFDNSKQASFFMSDDLWHRGTEIAQDMGQRMSEEERKNSRFMHKSKLADYIDDPHQKILYVFDPEKEWVFNIELLKVVQDDGKSTYPKCIKSVGPAPKQYKEVKLPQPEEFEEDEEPVKEKIFSSEEKLEEQETKEDEDGNPAADTDTESDEEELPGGELDGEEPPGAEPEE